MAKLDEQASKKLDEFFKDVEDKANVIFNQPKAVLDEVVQNFIFKIKSNLKENDLEASGRLSASIQALPYIVSTGSVKVKIELEDYWKDVDEGTKPIGFTKENRRKLQPLIRKWISEKPSLQQMAGTKKAQRSLSYAIATNILKKGTIKRFGYKGSKFLTSELPMFKENITKAINYGINNL